MPHSASGSADSSSHVPVAFGRFVDRVDHKRIFESALAAPLQRSGAQPRHEVYVWEGKGGQGKTSLRNEFCKTIVRERSDLKKRIALSVLDFAAEEQRSPLVAMLKIRVDLGHSGRLDFHLFDFAFAHLFSLEHPNAQLKDKFPELFPKEMPLTEKLMEKMHESVGATDDVLKINEMLKVVKVVAGFAEAIPWASLAITLARNAVEYGPWLIGKAQDCLGSPDVKRHRSVIGTLTSTQLREKLVSYLGIDLQRAIQADESPRLVLMFDSYESLWPAGAGHNKLRTDTWIRSLVKQTPGMLIAIFAREKPECGIDQEWNDILDSQPVKCGSLGDLPREDADQLLEAAGIASRSIRERILQTSLLPHHLEIALETFTSIISAGRKPRIEDFSKVSESILERFLDHLSDQEEINLRLASYPEQLDEELFADLCTQFLGGEFHGDWPRLSRRTFVTRQDHGQVRLHAVVRKGLQDRESAHYPRRFAKVHKWLHERYSSLADSAGEEQGLGEKHDGALLRAAAHLVLADAGQAVAWIQQQQWKKFYDAKRWRVLIEVFNEIAEQAGSAANDIWFNHHRAHVCQKLGLNQEAEIYYRQAQDLHARSGLPRDAAFATILHGLGDVRVALAGDKSSDVNLGAVRFNHAEAVRLYEDALALYEASPAAYPHRHAEVVFSLALLYEAMDKKEAEAVGYGRRALALPQVFANDGLANADREAGYANFLLRFGRARQRNNDFDAAEAHYREALKVYARTVSDNRGELATQLELATCLDLRGNNPDGAAAHFNVAVSRYETELGSEDADLGRALHLQAAFWHKCNIRQTESAPQLQRAIAILEQSLGSEHEWTREARAASQRLSN